MSAVAAAAPGLGMHLQLSCGKGRPVGEHIINMMFPGGDNGHNPTIAVTGNNGKTTTVHLIVHLIHETGLRIGMTTTDGVYIEGRRIDTDDCSGPSTQPCLKLHVVAFYEKDCDLIAVR